MSTYLKRQQPRFFSTFLIGNKIIILLQITTVSPCMSFYVTFYYRKRWVIFLAREQKHLENTFKKLLYLKKILYVPPLPQKNPTKHKKDKSQKFLEEIFQNRQHKPLRIGRSMFTSSLFLKDFEPTLPISPEWALILCGILSISSDIFNSIKYSLDHYCNTNMPFGHTAGQDTEPSLPLLTFCCSISPCLSILTRYK